MGRIVLHADFDHFYAQCEETRNPLLRAAPLVVCVFSGRGGDSGAVATANYLARAHGVGSGMAINLARRRLRDVEGSRFLPVDFAFYEGISERAMGILRGHADTFEYVGRDEAYMDVTQRTSGDYGTARHVAQQVKNDVRSALSLTCSVGVSPNRLVSKIASGHQKPDGLTVVAPGELEGFLGPLGVRRIPGLGKRAEEALVAAGMRTVADVRARSVFALSEVLGRRMGTYLHNASRGIDGEPVAERGPNVQYSRITTLERDSTDAGFLAGAIPRLCAGVHESLAADARTFRSVGVLIVQANMATKSRSVTLRNATSSLAEMERAASSLLREAMESQEVPVRRLGVRVSDLGDAGGQSSMDDYA